MRILMPIFMYEWANILYVIISNGFSVQSPELRIHCVSFNFLFILYLVVRFEFVDEKKMRRISFNMFIYMIYTYIWLWIILNMKKSN